MDDHVLRWRAAQALWVMGAGAEDAVPALQFMLRDTDPGVREWCAMALGAAGTAAKQAAPSLIEVMNDRSERPAVRGAAAEALGRLTVDAVKPLVAALKDEQSQVRYGADDGLRALADLPDAPDAIPALKEATADDDPTVREKAASLLNHIFRTKRR